MTLPGATEPGDALAHKVYLRQFLVKGFLALEELERLDAAEEEMDDDEQTHKSKVPRLPGLGYERAANLYAACTAEPSLLSAVYWVVCACNLLEEPLAPEIADQVSSFLLSCHCKGGGFRPHPKHEPNLLSSLSAIQLLMLLGQQDTLCDGKTYSAEETVSYVRSLRLSGGAFCGRQATASESDCRFVYAALCLTALLRGLAPATAPVGAALDSERRELDETVEWLLRCQNLDGGFGCRPDGESESHAGHTFCCLAGLALAGGLHRISARGHARLVRWLCDRQSADGGLNGRPGKASDVCYTWWTLASAELCILSRRHAGTLVLSDMFRIDDLCGFVTLCTSPGGGVAAHPGGDPDPFHTFFGLAGLSLLQHAGGCMERWVGQVSPLVALPVGLVPQHTAFISAGLGAAVLR